MENKNKTRLIATIFALSLLLTACGGGGGGGDNAGGSPATNNPPESGTPAQVIPESKTIISGKA